MTSNGPIPEPKSIAIPPTGVYVPVPTFFKPSSASKSLQPELDVETQIQHSIYLAKNGIRGLVLDGSTGEPVHMSAAEQHALISGVRKGLDDADFPDYPIMAGVLVNSLEDAIEGCRNMQRAGAQWALVLVPGYYGDKATQEGIKEWYTLVADNSPIPILIYHYPGVTNNVAVSIATYELLAQHPNIVGCKMSHGNVSHHLQVSCNPLIRKEKFRVFSGFGQQLGPIVLFNAAGVIDGLAAIYPKAVVRLMDLAEKRPVTDQNLAEMQRLQFASSRASELIGKWGILGIREGIYRELGMGNLEGGRLPLRGKIPDGEWEQLKTLYQPVQKIEKAL